MHWALWIDWHRTFRQFNLTKLEVLALMSNLDHPFPVENRSNQGLKENRTGLVDIALNKLNFSRDEKPLFNLILRKLTPQNELDNELFNSDRVYLGANNLNPHAIAVSICKKTQQLGTSNTFVHMQKFQFDYINKTSTLSAYEKAELVKQLKSAPLAMIFLNDVFLRKIYIDSIGYTRFKIDVSFDMKCEIEPRAEDPF